MGTFHLNHNDFKPLLDQAFEKLAQCEHYYGEMDLTTVDPALVAQVMQKQPLPSSRVLKLLKNRNKFFTKTYGIDLLSYTHKPLFSILNELTIGLFTEELTDGSIDEELLRKSMEEKLTLGGLETFQEQMAIMQSLEDKHLEKQVIDMLKHPRRHSKSLGKMFRYYIKGKTGKLFKYALKNIKGNSYVLIDERNHLMTSRIIEIIKSSDKNFFSFGAGHLKGPLGILTLLKKEGMLITKV